MPAVHRPHRVPISMRLKTCTLSYDVIQRIVFHVESLQISGSTPASAPVTGPPKLYANDDNGMLKSLRLVNKAFRNAATPFVFKCVAFFPAIRSKRVDVQTLMSIVNSDIAVYVKTLVIRPMLSSSVDEQWLQCTQFAHALPICFAKFRNLSAICIDGSIFLGLDREPKQTYETILLLSLRRSFLKAVHSASAQAEVRGLTGLELDFPILEGFFQSFSGHHDQISGALPRLEHLAVTQHAHARITHPSSLTTQQLYYPDLQYQGRFWTFIGLATNLRSLKIHCSNVLNLDEICLSSLQKLEVLDLARVRCRTETLISICSPSRASLKSLLLSEIRLITGLWADVFHRLKEIPTLTVFDPKSLTYDMPSPHFAKILHPFDPYLEIPRRDDRDAFQDLMKAVNMKRRLGNACAASNGKWMPLAGSLPN
ncbi:hypothetical protein AX15_001699 [Amanita polypyramis BW_CC]|nr:hypothetical protein AX15_001699 [Amanita polypyramis BW_CC]